MEYKVYGFTTTADSLTDFVKEVEEKTEGKQITTIVAGILYKD